VSGFFRLHPLFPEHIEALQALGSVTRRGTTVGIDLTLSPEEIWRRVRRNHQRNIEQSRQRGVAVTMDCGTEALVEFEPIYRESMDRVGATGYYYFPPAYFQELSGTLGNRLWTCTARRSDGDAVASILLVECGPIVQYHLGGTRTTALALTPTKLLFDHAWRWAKARGRRVFHLGGGVGSAEDSLFYFKAGFSDQRLAFFTWQIVFFEEAYQSLEARRRQREPQAIRPEFFPAYRA
jgi:lipid II:glycine glycyltransferase (peptidoglycan interpeptide bridge formation enzyme)